MVSEVAVCNHHKVETQNRLANSDGGCVSKLLPVEFACISNLLAAVDSSRTLLLCFGTYTPFGAQGSHDTFVHIRTLLHRNLDGVVCGGLKGLKTSQELRLLPLRPSQERCAQLISVSSYP